MKMNKISVQTALKRCILLLIDTVADHEAVASDRLRASEMLIALLKQSDEFQPALMEIFYRDKLPSEVDANAEST